MIWFSTLKVFGNDQFGQVHMRLASCVSVCGMWGVAPLVLAQTGLYILHCSCYLVRIYRFVFYNVLNTKLGYF